MSWENSKALTPLKRDFLRRFFEHEQSFYLTGGSALGIFYLQHRRSYDLDFFTQESHLDWHLLQIRVRAIAEEMAATCLVITASPEFYRFELTRAAEREILDFVIERVPQVDPQKTQFGTIRVDTLREILVNKITTLIDRCEVKDLIDLYFLQQHGLDVAAHFALAQQKQGGLDPAMISYLLASLHVEHPPDYLIAPLDLVRFNGFIRQLQKTMAEWSFPEESAP